MWRSRQSSESWKSWRRGKEGARGAVLHYSFQAREEQEQPCGTLWDPAGSVPSSCCPPGTPQLPLPRGLSSACHPLSQRYNLAIISFYYFLFFSPFSFVAGLAFGTPMSSQGGLSPSPPYFSLRHHYL